MNTNKTEVRVAPTEKELESFKGEVRRVISSKASFPNKKQLYCSISTREMYIDMHFVNHVYVCDMFWKEGGSMCGTGKSKYLKNAVNNAITNAKKNLASSLKKIDAVSKILK